MSKAGEPFRTRLSLSFLTQCSGETLSRQHGQATLCESVISFGIAVHSIDYWDVYCFEEGDTDISIFGFDFEDQESGSESDFQMPEEMLRHSPRTYFLHVMNLSLERVLDQHAEILEVFQDFIKGRGRYSSVSLFSGNPMIVINKIWKRINIFQKSAKQPNESAHNRRQLKEVIRQLLHSVKVLTRNVEEFLSNDPRKDLEGVPHGGGFVHGSKRNDMEKPLRQIHWFCGQLRDVQLTYQQLEAQMTSGSREQEVRDKHIQQITVAAFVLAILNLIAQVYTGYGSNSN